MNVDVDDVDDVLFVVDDYDYLYPILTFVAVYGLYDTFIFMGICCCGGWGGGGDSAKYAWWIYGICCGLGYASSYIDFACRYVHDINDNNGNYEHRYPRHWNGDFVESNCWWTGGGGGISFINFDWFNLICWFCCNWYGLVKPLCFVAKMISFNAFPSP